LYTTSPLGVKIGCLRTAMQTVCPPQKNTVPVKNTASKTPTTYCHVRLEARLEQLYAEPW
jgi:hypothetical protein